MLMGKRFKPEDITKLDKSQFKSAGNQLTMIRKMKFFLKSIVTGPTDKNNNDKDMLIGHIVTDPKTGEEIFIRAKKQKNEF